MATKKTTKTLQKSKATTLDGKPLMNENITPKDVQNFTSVKRIQELEAKKTRKK